MKNLLMTVVIILLSVSFVSNAQEEVVIDNFDSSVCRQRLSGARGRCNNSDELFR